MATTSDNNKPFDLERLLYLFKACRQDADVINIDSYNDAYDELCKLFNIMGKVFSFVAADVIEKVGILREYRKSPESSEYESIQSMIKYEVDNKITDNKKKASGCRTLLRLHRALEFTFEFMEEVCNAELSAKMSKAASEAYGRSLSKHHPFLIRQAVYLAVHTLPKKGQLMKNMNISDEAKGKELLQQLIIEQKYIFNVTEKLYSNDSLLDLP